MGCGLTDASRLSRARSATTTVTIATPTVSVALPTSNSLLVFILSVIVMTMGIATVTDAQSLRGSLGGGSGSEKQLCDIHQCWTLYQAAQDYHNVVYEPQISPDASKLPALCLTQRTFYRCLKAMYANKSLDCHSNIGFRSAFNGIERNMANNNCSHEGEVFDSSVITRLPERVCTYNGPPRMRFCTLFGDPHLRTFGDKFETCQVQGAWPLLDNRYLTVQVTSKAVGAASGPATAITELTVMIKAHEDCAARRFVTYQADAHVLPATFDNGSDHFGPDRSVVLEEISPNRHIEIYLRYIDTTVVVRRYHKFLTVSLLMPEKILNQSTSHVTDGDNLAVRTLELCSRGCPDNQRIDYMAYIASAHSVRLRPTESQRLFATEKNSVSGMEVMMTRQQALDWCKQLHLVDFYLDSCVFDLLNTGNTNFSKASVDAQSDTVRLHPDGAGALQNRTELGDLPDVRSSAVSVNRTLQCYAVIAAIVACALAQSLSGAVSFISVHASTGNHKHHHHHPRQQQQKMQKYHHHHYSHHHKQYHHTRTQRINTAIL